MRLDLTTLLVRDYDEAIAFFTTALGFELTEDTPRPSDGAPDKRWVVVRPPAGGAGLLLARAEGDEQVAATGRQAGGRVGHFLQVDDFATQHARMVAAGVEFLEEPRHEVYGTVVVFRDVSGNTWDLLGPNR
ncbi:VOC family protein [Nocardioides psychrotolerans]|uniref:VOC family protein n=1 Tax=Nocardioides psychrotolerans TaxID=1005945 RepID=UPI003137B6C2